MSRILISHTDLDGTGSIVLAEYFQSKFPFEDILVKDYGFEEEIKGMNYIGEFDEIIIADLTLPEEKIKPWIEAGKDVRIFDHHAETSWINNYPNCVWDENRCGTKIFWEEYLRPNVGRYKPIVDHFVEIVDTYDQWKEGSDLWEEAKNLNNILYGIKNYGALTLYEQTSPFWELMHKKFDKLKEWRWTFKEEKILEKAHKREEEMYEKGMSHISIRKDSEGHIFGVIMIGSKISITASRILTELDYLDYLIIINTYGGVTGKLSFRSRRGFNCNTISVAKGHDEAAGATVSPEQAKRFWENENLSFTYNKEYEESEEIFNEIIFDEET